MKRLHCIVEGRVQGVGFRFFTRREAERLGVRGWVRNRVDGSVELVAEAEESVLRELLAAVARGPRAARVERVVEEWAAAAGEFVGFGVRGDG